MSGKLYALGLALILSTLILSSCSSGEEAGQPSTSASLVGTEWMLTSLNGDSLIEGTSITLKFDQAFLSGSAGCNGYGGGRDSGKYVATDEGALTIPQIAVTLRLCLGPCQVQFSHTPKVQQCRAVLQDSQVVGKAS